ncbi:Na+/H+ antiporter NhaA [Halosquirtibacter xylanolyticus]|uniref:Na+/H+ antiporter NhaA n=1 Tax=Halosquirtibacter xylanolyticus TaxID=3374599 RepID=UPI0037489B45|nr:Na+/H+ antiporter NhaA [Prolixibacteraceae bacterium]
MNIESKKTGRIRARFHQFLEADASGGVLLIICTFAALLWANSPFQDAYEHLLHSEIAIHIGSFHFEMHLLHWVNDVLMAIFFFVVGLEIKREIIAGELSSFKKAVFPALGAVGGMLFPAVLFVLLAGGRAGSQGWGIPMATDIAFSLGILSLLGKRVPLPLKVFLVALAIVDDLGAIVVIALFYTSNLAVGYLYYALAILAVMFVLNRKGVYKIYPYVILGIVVWYFFYLSGIHATIAGVLVAFTIPIRRELDEKVFNKTLTKISIDPSLATPYTISDSDIHKIDHLRKNAKRVLSPVQYLEHKLHKLVNFFIMPVFAIANAGVHLSSGNTGGEDYSYISMCVGLSLLLGKTLGIVGIAWIGVKLKIAELPSGIKWKQMFGVAMLGGLGFTMSLFISNLAYMDVAMLSAAKIGVLIGSTIAGVLGYCYLKITLPEGKCA